MNRLIAPVVACALLAACSVSVDGPCTSDAQCTAPATCDLKRNACLLPCEPKCGVGQLCIDRACVQQGPVVKSLVAPTTWTTRAGTLAVTALVDDGQGPGTASAALHIAGQQDIAGTSTDGLTWTFQVPASTAQQPGHETPVAFTIDAIDKAGHATLPDAVGTGQLLIDDVGASLPSGVLANGGVVAAGGLSWFPAAGSGTIDVQAVIADAGSGVKQDTLTLMDGATRLDVGTPTCTGAPSSLTCHFTVPKSVVPAGSQRVVRFAVAGTDVAGNPLAANAAALGIDGKPPVVTLTVGASGTTTLYPPKNADCGAPLDSTLYCGHDGAHFWRAGDGKYKITFTVNDTFTAPDDVGSGPGAAGASCTITGSATTCTATFDPASGSFSFPADFATAAFVSAPDGTGTVTVTVNAKDAVGNGPASPVTATIGVTRVRWMRQVPGVNALVGAPLLAAGLQEVIVAGNSPSADPIASVKTDGGLGAFKFGSGKFTTVTANMALDTTPSTDPAHPTPVLYVNNGSSVYAVTTADATQYCAAVLSASNMSGSPVIFGGGASADVVVAAGNSVGAFTPSFSTSHVCLPHGSSSFTNPPLPPPATVTPQPKLGPPSANGSTIFFAYDNSLYSTAAGAATNDLGVKSIHFAAGAFDTPAGSNLGKEPTTNTNPAAISVASDLFFGVNRDGLFYRYGTDFALHWGSTPALTGNIFTQPLVRGASVLGSSDSLVSYGLVDGKKLWQVSRGGSQVSPPTTANGSIFVSDDVAPGEMVALDPSSQAVQWSYTGGATVPVTTLQSVATEATLDADGTLYFGDSAGHVYALITEARPMATAPGDWPRTGYDNCNSNHANNPGFSCQ